MIVWITATGLVLAAAAEASAKIQPPPPIMAPPAPPPIFAPPPAPPPPVMANYLDPLGPHPLGSPGSWVTSADYPIAAMRAGESGTVGFVMEIDASGSVTNCNISRSSHSPILDDATCKLLVQRAHFVPGHDATGKPVASVYRSSVRWTIPAGQPVVLPPPLPPMFGQSAGVLSKMAQPRPLGDPGNWITLEDYPSGAARARTEGTVGFRLDISPQGNVDECTVIASSNSPLLDTATCRLLKQRAIFKPATDLQGNATAGSFWNRITWHLPDEPEAPKPLHFRVSFTVDESGEVHDCRFELATGEGVKMAEALGRGCAGWMRYKPFTDAKGHPIRQRVTIAQDVTTEAAPVDGKATTDSAPSRRIQDIPGLVGGG